MSHSDNALLLSLRKEKEENPVGLGEESLFFILVWLERHRYDDDGEIAMSQDRDELTALLAEALCYNEDRQHTKFTFTSAITESTFKKHLMRVWPASLIFYVLKTMKRDYWDDGEMWQRTRVHRVLAEAAMGLPPWCLRNSKYATEEKALIEDGVFPLRFAAETASNIALLLPSKALKRIMKRFKREFFYCMKTSLMCGEEVAEKFKPMCCFFTHFMKGLEGVKGFKVAGIALDACFKTAVDELWTAAELLEDHRSGDISTRLVEFGAAVSVAMRYFTKDTSAELKESGLQLLAMFGRTDIRGMKARGYDIPKGFQEYFAIQSPIPKEVSSSEFNALQLLTSLLFEHDIAYWDEFQLLLLMEKPTLDENDILDCLEWAQTTDNLCMTHRFIQMVVDFLLHAGEAFPATDAVVKSLVKACTQFAGDISMGFLILDAYVANKEAKGPPFPSVSPTLLQVAKKVDMEIIGFQYELMLEEVVQGKQLALLPLFADTECSTAAVKSQAAGTESKDDA